METGRWGHQSDTSKTKDKDSNGGMWLLCQSPAVSPMSSHCPQLPPIPTMSLITPPRYSPAPPHCQPPPTPYCPHPHVPNVPNVPMVPQPLTSPISLLSPNIPMPPMSPSSLVSPASLVSPMSAVSPGPPVGAEVGLGQELPQQHPVRHVLQHRPLRRAVLEADAVPHLGTRDMSPAGPSVP